MVGLFFEQKKFSLETIIVLRLLGLIYGWMLKNVMIELEVWQSEINKNIESTKSYKIEWKNCSLIDLKIYKE